MSIEVNIMDIVSPSPQPTTCIDSGANGETSMNSFQPVTVSSAAGDSTSSISVSSSSNVSATPAPVTSVNHVKNLSRIAARKTHFKSLSRNEKINRLAGHSNCKVSLDTTYKDCILNKKFSTLMRIEISVGRMPMCRLEKLSDR